MNQSVARQEAIRANGQKMRPVFALVFSLTLLEPVPAICRTKTLSSRVVNQIIETCHLREVHSRPHAQCVASQSSALRELIKLIDVPEPEKIKAQMQHCMALTRRREGLDYVETLSCLRR